MLFTHLGQRLRDCYPIVQILDCNNFVRCERNKCRTYTMSDGSKSMYLLLPDNDVIDTEFNGDHTVAIGSIRLYVYAMAYQCG